MKAHILFYSSVGNRVTAEANGKLVQEREISKRINKRWMKVKSFPVFISDIQGSKGKG
jgi:hypothetical protein